MPTPVVYDVFSRMLMTGFDEHVYIRLPTAFQAMFGRPATGSYTVFSPNANEFDIEITRGDERLAALIPRGINAKFGGSPAATGGAAGHQSLQAGVATTFSRKYPLVEEDGAISADQLNQRVVPYEMPYENWTKEDRMRNLAQRIYFEAIRRIIRLQEFLASQSVRLGLQSAQNVADTTVNFYDWRRNSSNHTTPTHGWGNASGVPLTDLDTANAQIRTASKNSGGPPDFAIFGGLAMLYFFANAQIQTNYGNKLYFDLLRFEGDYKPEPKFAHLVEGGCVPFGKLRTPMGFELTIFTYPEWYLSTAGVATKYMPDADVLVGCSGARCDRYFGPAEKMPLTAIQQAQLMERFGWNPAVPPLPPNIKGGAGVIQPQMFYCDGYDGENAKTTTIRVQAAPVFPTTMTDCFYYISTVGNAS